MGLIKSLAGAIGGGLGDQWLEVIESDTMTPQTILAPGVRVRPNDPRNTNTQGTVDTISNGSQIHVQEGQFMMLVDGGKIVDYTAEPGYYTVDNSSLPSLMNGQLGGTLKETFNRFRYSGSTPLKQKVVFVNLQEIRGIKYGTPNPVAYFDSFYNAELFLRSFGTYSIRVVDPIKFYIEVGDRSMQQPILIEDVNDQYRGEFLTAFQAALNQYSANGERVSFIQSKGEELRDHMQQILDDRWTELRGFVIEAVSVNSISYTEESQEIIGMRNRGAALSDPSIREGYVQGSVARGIEAAGSNEGGAGNAFIGMGLGMGTMGGGGMGQFSQSNQQQMQNQQNQQQQQQQAQQYAQQQAQQQADQLKNDGREIKVEDVGGSAAWFCPECGTENTGKFCTNCGTKKPEPKTNSCSNCGATVPADAKFCPECGHDQSAPAPQDEAPEQTSPEQNAPEQQAPDQDDPQGLNTDQDPPVDPPVDGGTNE